MSEQTYMKLEDKVNRPKLSRENINRENKQFKRVVDQYEQWCTSGGGYETRETYEEDIIDCLFEIDNDGFALAQYLSECKYIEPDSELVYILDGVSTIKDSLSKEIIGKWTKENFLEIPSDVIGKKVNAKHRYNKLQAYLYLQIHTMHFDIRTWLHSFFHFLEKWTIAAN